MQFGRDIQLLLTLVETIRDRVDRNIPITALHALVAIALRPGITMAALEKEVGVSQSTTVRNIQTLSAWDRDKPGLGLVEATDDPHESRRKILFLTKKGGEVMERLISLMRNEAVSFKPTTASDHLKPVLAERARLIAAAGR